MLQNQGYLWQAVCSNIYNNEIILFKKMQAQLKFRENLNFFLCLASLIGAKFIFLHISIDLMLILQKRIGLLSKMCKFTNNS